MYSSLLQALRRPLATFRRALHERLLIVERNVQTASTARLYVDGDAERRRRTPATAPAVGTRSLTVRSVRVRRRNTFYDKLSSSHGCSLKRRVRAASIRVSPMSIPERVSQSPWQFHRGTLDREFEKPPP
ncbi:hypothetical protein EVAR_18539_1 [Eumeta japonica]|uniref:Uncharacterized protein n=1 Tax=Eumeta variegata TaxID=151549 RepID=A0A4C1V2Q5_EUMVA|nr:hypothetical protein EVAR_18539_1 [Eumeta japonica]